jgi:hypothetical protein
VARPSSEATQETVDALVELHPTELDMQQAVVM